MLSPECIVVIVIAVLSALLDWKKRMIPNRLALGGIFIGFLLSIFHGELGFSLLGFGSACLLLVPYKMGWLGGGDVKLLMAYGSLVGPWHLLDLWIGAALLSIPIAWYVSYKTKKPLKSIGVPYAVPLGMMAVWIAGRGLLYS
jgi:prepilin peptidase CpaA